MKNTLKGTVAISDIQQFPERLKRSLRQANILYDADFSKLNLRDITFLGGVGPKGQNLILDYCKEHDIKLNERSGLNYRISELSGSTGLAL
jgi:hypothetical protein